MPGWLTDHFQFVTFGHSAALSARVPESQKLKMIGYPAFRRIPEL